MIYKETLLKVSGLDLFSKSILGKEDHTRSGHKWIGEQLESWGTEERQAWEKQRSKGNARLSWGGGCARHMVGAHPYLINKHTQNLIQTFGQKYLNFRSISEYQQILDEFRYIH